MLFDRYTPVDLQPNRADVMGGSSSSPSKEKTNFLKAARSGNLQGVHEYLKQGGDVNAANEVSHFPSPVVIKLLYKKQ